MLDGVHQMLVSGFARKRASLSSWLLPLSSAIA